MFYINITAYIPEIGSCSWIHKFVIFTQDVNETEILLDSIGDVAWDGFSPSRERFVGQF